MNIFRKNKFKDHDLLYSFHNELIDDCLKRLSPYLDSELISNSRLFAFILSFNLACYSVYRKKTERNAMDKYVTENCNSFIKEGYGRLSPDSTDRLFNEFIEFIEVCQDEYIEAIAEGATTGEIGSLTKAVYNNIVPPEIKTEIPDKDDLLGRLFMVTSRHLNMYSHTLTKSQ